MWYIFANKNKVLDELYQQAMNLLEGHFLYSIVSQEVDKLPITQQGLRSGFGVDINLAKDILLDFAKLHLIAYRDEAFNTNDVDYLINEIIQNEVKNRYNSSKDSPDYISLVMFPSLYGAWFSELMNLGNFYVLNSEKNLKINRLKTSLKILKDCKRPSRKKVYDATEYITINVNVVYDLIGKGLIKNGIM